jgi:hypothetical protein
MSISALIRLRLLQTYRILKEVGWLILLLLLFVSVALVSQLVLGLISSSLWQAFSIGLVLLAIVHFGRKDLVFLQIYTNGNGQIRGLLLCEYFLLLSPLMLITLLSLNWSAALGLGLSGICSLLFPISRSFLLKKSWNPTLGFIPDDLFELKTLLRRRFPVLIAIYLLGMLSFLHIAFFVACIVLISLLISSAFEWIEPPTIINWHKRFFFHKIGRHSLFIHLVLLPVYILSLLFHPEEYYFTLAGLFILQLAIVFSIFYKYALYRPRVRRLPQNMVHAIYFLFLLIPGFQLVCLLLCIWYGVKAHKTMSYFWKDQNIEHAPNK